MRRSFLYILLLGIFFSSCRTDFDVNDKWKEINIIYGLLDAKDSMILENYQVKQIVYTRPVQYFRITKAFLNEGRSALQIAKSPDSLYNPRWVVTLQELRGNTVSQSYRLIKTTEIPRDPGIFSESQVLYKTPSNFKLDSDAVYKIIVRDSVTGVETTAQTNVTQIGGTKRGYPLDINFIKGQTYQLTWNSGKNVRFYDLTMKIYYQEWPKSNPSAVTEKVVTWPVAGSLLTDDLSGVSPVTYNIEGEEFFNFMATSIPEDPSVQRKMKGIETLMQGGGSELYNYIQVYRPSIGIVQKKPEYTNVNNGYGIFSSRNATSYFLPLNASALDTLINQPPTRKLNFVK